MIESHSYTALRTRSSGFFLSVQQNRSLVSEDLDSQHVRRTAKTNHTPLAEGRNLSDTYNQQLYDLASTVGLPIGVQTSRRRFDEEKALGGAEVLQTDVEKQRQGLCTGEASFDHVKNLGKSVSLAQLHT